MVLFFLPGNNTFARGVCSGAYTFFTVPLLLVQDQTRLMIWEEVKIIIGLEERAVGQISQRIGLLLQGVAYFIGQRPTLQIMCISTTTPSRDREYCLP